MKKIIKKENLVKYRKAITGGAVLILIAYYLLIANNLFFYSLSGHRVKKVYLDGNEFRMEMVNDVKDLSKGLGGRNHMCDDCGMFFDFNKDGSHGMWMKEMQFDLDIVWIRDGEVVWIEKNVSKDDVLTVYGANITSDAILELNTGTVDEYGLKRGDKVIVK